MTSEQDQKARDTYELLSSNELKTMRRTFKRNLRQVVAKARRESFAYKRITLINEILETRR